MQRATALLFALTLGCASSTGRDMHSQPPSAPTARLDFSRALTEPRDDCAPKPPRPTGNPYVDCVARINQLRTKCQGLPPLARWKAGERCANEHIEHDAKSNSIHAAMQKGLCNEPFVWAQNECVGFFGYTRPDAINTCLQTMWDEGPGDDFHAHGHYINMSDRSYSRVACGFYETPKGEIWSAQNFSR